MDDWLDGWLIGWVDGTMAGWLEGWLLDGAFKDWMEHWTDGWRLIFHPFELSHLRRSRKRWSLTCGRNCWRRSSELWICWRFICHQTNLNSSPENTSPMTRSHSSHRPIGTPDYADGTRKYDDSWLDEWTLGVVYWLNSFLWKDDKLITYSGVRGITA